MFAVIRCLPLRRGQPIRPILAGFGEPFTDWLFQTAHHATPGSSAFSLAAGDEWLLGSGWLLVYALRWMGKSRRIPSPDSLVVCFLNDSKDVKKVSSIDAMALIAKAEPTTHGAAPLREGDCLAALKIAQQTLKECAANRDSFSRGSAGISLFSIARIETVSPE